MPWRILVVTEDPQLATLAGKLAALGYHAHHTSDSWQAVRRVLRDRKHPALIVLDANAPRALDFLSARGAIADIAVIPVVLITPPGSTIGLPQRPDDDRVDPPLAARLEQPPHLDQLADRIAELCSSRQKTSESGWTPPLGTTRLD